MSNDNKDKDKKENGNGNGQYPPKPDNGSQQKDQSTNQSTSAEGASVESNGALNTPVFLTVTEEELNQIKKEAAEYKDKYLRQLAETDNMRKRLQKERQELIQHAMQNVIVEFLNPIDHMENALSFTLNMSDEVKNWATGFQMILNQFKDVLTGHGVVPFSSKGMEFDPHHHEAIEITSTTDHPEGTIVSESLRGYKMGNRTIRPARVNVAKAPEKTTEQDEKKEDQTS